MTNKSVEHLYSGDGWLANCRELTGAKIVFRDIPGTVAGISSAGVLYERQGGIDSRAYFGVIVSAQFVLFSTWGPLGSVFEHSRWKLPYSDDDVGDIVKEVILAKGDTIADLRSIGGLAFAKNSSMLAVGVDVALMVKLRVKNEVLTRYYRFGSFQGFDNSLDPLPQSTDRLPVYDSVLEAAADYKKHAETHRLFILGCADSSAFIKKRIDRSIPSIGNFQNLGTYPDGRILVRNGAIGLDHRIYLSSSKDSRYWSEALFTTFAAARLLEKTCGFKIFKKHFISDMTYISRKMPVFPGVLDD